MWIRVKRNNKFINDISLSSFDWISIKVYSSSSQAIRSDKVEKICLFWISATSWVRVDTRITIRELKTDISAVFSSSSESCVWLFSDRTQLTYQMAENKLKKIICNSFSNFIRCFDDDEFCARSFDDASADLQHRPFGDVQWRAFFVPNPPESINVSLIGLPQSKEDLFDSQHSGVWWQFCQNTRLSWLSLSRDISEAERAATTTVRMSSFGSDHRKWVWLFYAVVFFFGGLHGLY